MDKSTIDVAEHYQVKSERGGDGSLYEVTDLSGKVISAHPMAWRAAVGLAQHLDCDAHLVCRGDDGDRE